METLPLRIAGAFQLLSVTVTLWIRDGDGTAVHLCTGGRSNADQDRFGWSFQGPLSTHCRRYDEVDLEIVRCRTDARFADPLAPLDSPIVMSKAPAGNPLTHPTDWARRCRIEAVRAIHPSTKAFLLDLAARFESLGGQT